MPEASTTQAGTQPAGDDTSGAGETARASATVASPALEPELTSSQPLARTDDSPRRMTRHLSIREG